VKVVQINNTGVVPYTITEYIRREHSDDIEVDIVIPMHSIRDEQFQRGISGIIELSGNPTHLIKWIRRNVMKYDIIHIHAMYQHLPLIEECMKDGAKIVYTGHGRDVRLGWHSYIPDIADKITCSTEDLVVDGVEWIPNVADPYHWKRKRKAIKGKALLKAFSDPIIDDKRSYIEAMDISSRRGFTLDVQDRGKGMYSYMAYPRFLEVYDTFFDYKYLKKDIGYDELIIPMSFTAIQFLQMGGTVIRPEGEYTELPTPFNDYDGVMKRWIEIYEGLLE